MRVNFIPLRVPVFTKVDRCCTSQSWAFALSCACRLSLRHPQTCFFLLDGFSLHMFLWDVSPCDVFFGFLESWLLNKFGCCSLCSRLQRGRQLRVPWTSGKKVVLHWADKAMSWVRFWSSLKIPCKLLAMKRWSCFVNGDFFEIYPLDPLCHSPWFKKT